MSMLFSILLPIQLLLLVVQYISANINFIPMLNETSFKDWKENVLIVLGCLDLDLAIKVTHLTYKCKFC